MANKIVSLPSDIEVEISNFSVKLHSELKDQCPYCNRVDCNFDCDASQEAYGSSKDVLEREEMNEEHLSRMMWNSAIDGMESLIVACAGAGVDIDTEKFKGAVSTALDTISNRFGD